MRSPSQESAELFQQQVADLLELPPGSADAEVRQALRLKGPDYIDWYDTRLRAIAESNQRSLGLDKALLNARRAKRHH